MKKLIICEGKHDNIFMDKLSIRLNVKDKTKIFRQEECSRLRQKNHAETICLNSFFQDSSPYEILVKSESGKDAVYKVFSKIMESLFEKTRDATLQKIILMIDLDGKPLDVSLFKIKDFISNRKGRKMYINPEIIKNDKSIISLKASILREKFNNTSETIGGFLLITWKENLDNAAGIKKGSDNLYEKDIKIMKMLENEDIFNHFSYILNM